MWSAARAQETQPSGPEVPASAVLNAPAPAATAPADPDAALQDLRVQWALIVEAPDTLKPLLEKHLDLARFQVTAQTERITRGELVRLLAATPQQAQDLLETEGYFSAKVSARLLADGESVASAAQSPARWLDPITLASKLVSEVDPLLRRITGRTTEAGPRQEPAADLRVLVQVDPGPRTRVQDVRIEFEGPLSVAADANDPEATALVDKVRKGWALPVRRSFTQDRWGNAKSQTLGLMRAEGYLSAAWSGAVAQIAPEDQKARLFLVADSGPLYRFGEPVFEGLDHVRPDALRAVLSFTTGEPLREKALLDYQDRLVKTGLFETVAVTIDPVPEQAQAVPVRVRVRERDRLQTTFGVGVSDNTGPRATLEHVDQQVFGLNWQAKTKLQWGHVTRSAALDLISHPKEDSHRNLVSAAASYSEASDNLAVTQQRARIGRTQDGERFERLYYLEWQRARTRELGGQAQDDASALSVAYQWVWRALDNPVSPTDGFALSASVAQGRSFATIGDSGWFTRATGRLTGYWKMGSWFGQARIEGAEVFKRDSVAVPYPLLFRAGGDDSVRGYGYQSLGPTNASGTAVGGKVMTTASVELATPFSRRNRNLLGAVFVDAGNAAPNWTDFSLAVGYGVGVRWRSPLGPLRIDLAYGEQVQRLRLHFSVGLTF